MGWKLECYMKYCMMLSTSYTSKVPQAVRMSSEFIWSDSAPSAATVGGDDTEQQQVLLLTLLESGIADGGGDGDGEHVTLHAPAASTSGTVGLTLSAPVKIETRLAMREALLPRRRSSRRRAGEPPPSCADCGREFDGQVALATHRTREHSSAPPHRCPLCSKTFVRRNDLKYHMNLHLGIKKSVCDVCGRQFSHMSNLYRHRRIHTGERPYVCSVCGKRFSQVNALNAHKEVHEKKATSQHKCAVCPKTFRNKPRLARHARLMHHTDKQTGARRQARRRFHCGVCGSSFPTRVQLLEHQDSHPVDSLRCGVCHSAFGSAAEMTRHACAPDRADDDDEPGDASDAEEGAPPPAAPPPPPPPAGRASFMLSDSRERKGEEEPPSLLAASRAADDSEVGRLMDEMVAVHNVGTQYDVTEILCLPTVAADGGEGPLDSPPPSPADHVDQVIEAVVRGELAPAPPAAGRASSSLMCATCGRQFSRLQNLRQHEAMHDASLQRYSCAHCPRTFAWQQTRDRHVSREHTGEQRLPCPECGQLFLPGSLRGHQQRIHMNVKKFFCTICSKSFYGKSEIDGHMRVHTQERPFVCAACGQQFGHLTHLRRHEDRHRQATETRSAEELAAVAEGLKPARHVYRPRRPRRRRPDIVQDSLESACIPLRACETGQYVTLIGHEDTEYLLVDD